jgi:RimJ/RimL family protein N-acetyltransferase
MLVGQNVILRLFRDDDLDEFFALRNALDARGEADDIELWVEAERRQQFAENGWWSEKLGRMALANKDDRVLGFLTCFKLEIEAALEVGYAVLRPEDRGRGLMTEALRIFSAYLFETRPIPRLQLRTSVENVPARRVAEKTGYQLEGVQRQVAFARGRHHDCAMYSLLRGECVSLAEALARQGGDGPDHA